MLTAPRKVIEFVGNTQMDKQGKKGVKIMPRVSVGGSAVTSGLLISEHDTAATAAALAGNLPVPTTSSSSISSSIATAALSMPAKRKADFAATNPDPKRKVISSGKSLSSGPPKNLYEVIKAVFETFWTLEFDDISVSHAFFAKITSANCREFGLQSFAEESCSLAVIQEKIEERKYFSAESFELDMKLMFANIIKHYSPVHPAHKTAANLLKSFESDWEAAQGRLSW